MEALKSVYKSVEDIDYLVGCLAEQPRPKGYVISDTAFYVFIMNASRRLLCDRFYQVRARLTLQALSQPFRFRCCESRNPTPWCEVHASHGTGVVAACFDMRSVLPARAPKR